MSSTPLFEVRVVGGDDTLVVSDLGISISTDCTLAELDEKRQDIIVVCGGFRVRLEGDAQLRAKLRSADAAGAVLGGLWNGAYFLAEAGLLDGHECAFHPDGRAMMSELFPKVSVTTHSQVLDRKRISCAGANSSLGMMLEVVRHSAGQELVSAVEEVLSCDKMRDVVDVSVVSIDFDPTLPQTIKLALELMHSNIEDPIEIDEIARYVGISRRHLERLFRRYVKATPPRYYLELRLTRARQLLQQTNKSLIEISVATGFVTLPHFTRCFRELFEMAPGQFRKRNHFKV
ncbi:HTH-type transcriptional regulator CdhR [compost metagenome]